MIPATNKAIQHATAIRFETLPEGPQVTAPSPWPPLMVRRAAIDREIERLLDEPRNLDGRRASSIVHPSATEPGPGIAPGLALSINVMRPGERININRDNASRVEFCLRGNGHALIGTQPLSVSDFATWNVPSMRPRQYRNNDKEPLVWLSYSNEPVLRKLFIYYSDAGETHARQNSRVEQKYVRTTAPDLPIGVDGARLRGYEFLTDIEVVENRALIWPFVDVVAHLSRQEGDGKRTILLLYNPATERRNGTTHSFFATIAAVPPGKARPAPARGHKHSSFACNYHFVGGGESVVDTQYFDWEAGDLMLSAPSWSEHAHGTGKDGAIALTIQDHPAQIGMESLIWQERMDGPILTLGSEPGQTGYVGPRLQGD
jgi:gentisate 1,2-dioxygenase